MWREVNWNVWNGPLFRDLELLNFEPAKAWNDWNRGVEVG